MRLVGRDTELATLTAALDKPDQIILLRGEAGIGKSRLADHIVDLATSRGLNVFRGQAHPLHAGLAYAPIVEAIRPHADEHPGLGTLLGQQGSSDDPDLNRTRMFEAVAGLVQHLSPAVFFVDDLHWADHGTIELVHYLGQNTTGALILAAYRPGETNPALDNLATTVRRHGTELALQPLTDDHVASIAHALLGSPPEPAFLDDVVQRAKGIPLFVTALVHSGFDSGGAVPTIVRDVVLSRLRRLDEPRRKIMEIVAVAGEAATDVVLTANDPAALRDLILDGLIVERPVGRTMAYRVAHPLYAEVAYAEMTLSERRALHAAVLAAIEQDDPNDVLALAPHYREAGSIVDPARAVAVMAEAGERAMTVRASEEAVRYFESALDLAEPEQAVDLLDGIGRAQRALGALDDAKATWWKGIKLADQHGLTKPLALFRFRLAMLDTEWQDTLPADDRLTAVRDVNVASPELAIQAFVYTMWHGSLHDARDLSITLAESLSSTHPAESRAVAHYGQAIRFFLEHDLTLAQQQAEAAVEQARQCDRASLLYLQFFLIAATSFRALSGDIAGAVAGAQEVVHAGAVVELPSLTWVAYHTLAACHYLAGDFDKALAEIDTAVAGVKAANMPRAIGGTVAMRAFLLAERGRLSDAASALAEARQAYPAPDHSLVEVIGLAATAIALYVDEPPPDIRYHEPATYGDPFSVILRGLFTSLAALNVGDPTWAIMHAEAVGAFKQPARMSIAFADRLTGLRTGDAQLLASTADRFAAMGAKVLAAQTRLEQLELQGSADGLPATIEVLAQAGATHWANRARQHARAMGMRLRPDRRNGPLTARETDVLRLLGDGLSNADIAARLFLSGRTVETHLRNSYAKLGLTTRIALARWAAENLR